MDIMEAANLVHYDENLPIILATDASKNGIGAVLSHRYPDGTEKPISFASKTLNSTQCKYSQIEKEALAIIFGVTRFHQYIYGRHFELTTDHQALTTLFHPHKKLPIMTLHRLQRWAIILQSYDYEIRYKRTTNHANADALSRLPMGEDIDFDNCEKNLLDIENIYVSTVDNFPIDADIVADHTKRDKILKRVAQYIAEGWPDHMEKSEGELLKYYSKQMFL